MKNPARCSQSFCFSIRRLTRKSFNSTPFRPAQIAARLHFGEVTGVAVNSRATCSFSRAQHERAGYAAARRSCWSSTATGSSSRDRQELYAWSFATRCAPTAATTSGSRTKLGHGVKFSRRARGDGVRPQAGSSDEETGVEASQPAAPAETGLPPGHRRHLDPPATPTSATATSTPASRRSTATATGSSRGATAQQAASSIPAQHRRGCEGNIYVADRGNRRIQVFDGDGAFLREMRIDVPYDLAARPAIAIGPTW